MDFLFRHFQMTLVQPRRAWNIRKAMREYARQHPVCEWDGKSRPIAVHHIIPMHISPDLAADPSNFISLGSKRNHFVIGHAGNWKTRYISNVRELCANKVIQEKVEKDIQGENIWIKMISKVVLWFSSWEC